MERDWKWLQVVHSLLFLGVCRRLLDRQDTGSDQNNCVFSETLQTTFQGLANQKWSIVHALGSSALQPTFCALSMVLITSLLFQFEPFAPSNFMPTNICSFFYAFSVAKSILHGLAQPLHNYSYLWTFYFDILLCTWKYFCMTWRPICAAIVLTLQPH